MDYKLRSEVALCQTAYAHICGIGVRTLQRYLRWARDESGPSPRGTPAGYQSRKKAAARVWLIKYGASHDKMPNSSCKKQPSVSHTDEHMLGGDGGRRITLTGGGDGERDLDLVSLRRMTVTGRRAFIC